MKTIFFVALFVIVGIVNGQDIDKSTCEKIKMYSNGNISKCKLKETVKISSYHCRDWIWFHENKKIKQCTIAESFEWGTYKIPSGSIVFFDSNGNVQKVWLSESVVYDGIKCYASKNEIEVSFYPSKKMKCCFLAENQIIQGWPCLASTLNPVCFYENGKLKEFAVSETKALDGKVYKKGTRIKLNEQGVITDPK